MEDRTSQVSPVERPPVDSGRDGAAPRVPLGPPHLADPRALTILTTEHWSLLSQRSLYWNESFSRAGMFLATLSAATVALALVGSVMRDGFIVFALVILPAVLFIGETTAVRLSQANGEEARALQGMNRIRHAYLEMVPELEPYFLMSHYDDAAGVLASSGVPATVAGQVAGPSLGSIVGNILHGFVTAMGMIMVIVSVVGAVYAGLVAAWLGASDVAALAIGALAFVVLVVLHAIWGVGEFRRAAGQMVSHFPTPPAGE
jgi:hypothetical protein